MSWTRTRQLPPGGSPPKAMSPPRPTSTPQPRCSASRAAARSAARALAVAPRSRRTPGGTVSRREPRSSRMSRQPGQTRTGQPHRWAVPGDQLEVAVIPQRSQLRGHGRIQVAVGGLGRVQRDGDRVGEHLAHRHRGSGPALGAGELGVGAKAAAGQVERREIAGQQLTAPRQPGRIGDHQAYRATDRGPAGGRGPRHGHQDAPEVASAPPEAALGKVEDEEPERLPPGLWLPDPDPVPGDRAPAAPDFAAEPVPPDPAAAKWCAGPGSAAAIAPVASTLATPTPAVVADSRLSPRRRSIDAAAGWPPGLLGIGASFPPG